MRTHPVQECWSNLDLKAPSRTIPPAVAMDLSLWMECERPTATIARAAVNDLGAKALQDEIEEGRCVRVGGNYHFGAVKGLHQGDWPNRPTAVRSPEEDAPSKFREHDCPLPDSVQKSQSLGHSIQSEDY
jgi:hypothetical protein